MNNSISAKRVINGTFGQVWLDGEEVGEAIGLKLTSDFAKEKVNLVGDLTEDTKLTSISNTGSLSLHKVNSRMLLKIGEEAQNGRDVRFTIISALKDPDSYGAERVAAYGVSFDNLTLADWQAATLGKIEAPFTFNRYKLLDEIGVR